MTQTPIKLSFEEYLTYNDGTDNRYELIDGELVAVPPEERGNSKIALFLLLELAKFLNEDRLCYKDTEIEVTGTMAQTRLPDLMVLSKGLAETLGDKRGTITRDMPPPELIVEVVSPGKSNEERDYIDKLCEYQSREVPEYWVIDPKRQKITVFILIDGLYKSEEYIGDRLIESRIEGLHLTAQQVLRRKRES